jgi:integrase
MASRKTLERLKAELLVGRSPHTVNSYLRALVAALNWAAELEWLPKRTRRQVVKADDPDKGRPITLEEFERMLDVTDSLCSHDPESWRHLLRGLWESGLQIGEALNLSWDIPGTIQPILDRAGGLSIPGSQQKNRKTEEIPITPAFRMALDSVPVSKRSGWVFNLARRDGKSGRPSDSQVERVISRIGEAARVRVNSKGKFATAHDLRRSFAQRLADAGLHPRDLMRVMRHSALETTERYYLRENRTSMSDRIADKLGMCDRSQVEVRKGVRRRTESSQVVTR